MQAVSGDELHDLALSLLQLSDDQLRVFLDSCAPQDLALAEFALGQVEQSGVAQSMRSEPALLAAYVTRNDARPFKLWRYVRLLSAQFKKLTTGESKFQLWSMPPRYGKSLVGCRWGPTWVVETMPASKTIVTSYASDLAESHAVFARDTIRANPDVFTARISRQRAARREFITTEGGGMRAAGFDGQITGFGAGNGGGIVIDDPFKGWPEAHSEAERDHVWNQWQSVIFPRLDDEDTWVLVIQTRWHEDDLIGRFTQREPEKWEQVRLPAIAERYDPDSRDAFLRVRDLLDRTEGETLEPERFSLAFEIERARGMGTYLAAGLLQQRPAPAEGGEIKRAWWKYTSNLPREHDEWVSSWDMKLKEKETGDFQVGQVWGRTGSAAWLHEQMRGQWTVLATACAIALLAVRYPKVRKHYVENSGNGDEVMATLRGGDKNFAVPKDIADAHGMSVAERKAVGALMRRGLPGVIPVNPKGDKRARARAEAAYVQAGNAWLPEGRDFAEALVNECAAFPNGTHDDQVDTWSQAFMKLFGRAGVRGRGASAQGEDKPSNWKN